MRRRTFLAVTGVGFSGGLAGCQSGLSDSPGEQTDQGDRDVGESAELNGVTVLVEDATVARRVRTESRHYEPFDGVYLLVHSESTNDQSEQSALPGSASFSAIIDSDQFDAGSPSGDFTDPVEGPPYAGGSDAHPDVSTSGWMLFEVPSQFDGIRLACSFSDGYEEEQETAYWSLSVDRSEAARLSVDVDGPETIEWGQTAEYTVSVENTGGRAGDIHHQANFGHPDGSVVFEDTRVIEVPANESLERTFSTTPDDLDPIEFRFGGRAYPIEVEPATAEIGETITAPTGVELTVDDLTVANYYRERDDKEATFADSGRQFSFVEYRAENPTNEEKNSLNDVLVSVDGAEYDYVPSRSLFSQPYLAEPVSGSWIYPSPTVPTGDTESGRLVHDVESSIRESEAVVLGKRGDQTVAIWE